MTLNADLRRAVLGWGLPGNANLVEPGIDDASLRDLVLWASTERLSGLLWAALEHHPRSERSEESRRNQLDTYLDGLRATLLGEATAAWAVDLLAREEIPAYLFKGLAAAHLDYPDPAWRASLDVDLVVRRRDLPRALAALQEAECVREVPPLRSWWEHRYARAVVLRSPGGAEIDVHASIAEGYFGQMLDHEGLLADHEEITLGGVTCRTFGAPGRLLGSAYAVVLSRGPSARLLRDLAQQLLVTKASWEVACELAGDGRAVLAAAFQRLGDELGVEHSAIDWGRALLPGRVAFRALDLARAAEQRGWSADARSSMMALSVTDKARFAVGVAVPSSAYRSQCGRTTGERLRRLRGRLSR